MTRHDIIQLLTIAQALLIGGGTLALVLLCPPKGSKGQ